MKLLPITILGLALAVLPAAAEEEHRELGAHEHGHGTLDIAIEKTRVTMELETPGMDIVGFEHEAESKEQKAAVEKAVAQLADALSLFKMPASAGCKVAEAKVEIETGHEHEDGDKDHAKEEHGEHKGEKHEEKGHNEFHATYALDCAKPAALTSIAFEYFKVFAGANAITVNVVTAKAQNKYEVSREKPVLDLGGMM
jgi:hypothetical protein